MKNEEEIEEIIDHFLNGADGELIITVHGLNTDMKGEINKGGAMMAAYSLLKAISRQQEKTFGETLDFMNALSGILNTEVSENKKEHKDGD